MLSLPLITPRDSHELWFGSSQPYRTSQHHHHQTTTDAPPPLTAPRRNGHHANGRASSAINNTLSTLLLEERALRARKNNIASFGYSWIKPAGCSKTMLGMKEEEAEREEALAAAAAEMAAAAAATADPALDEFGDPMHDQGDESGMERDLDDDIPDADADGLVEEGDEGLEEEDVEDEEGYMERDLDDDIPEAFADDDEDGDEDEEELEEHEDFADQPDLDDDIPSAANDYDEDDMSDVEEEEGSGGGEEDLMERNLDDDIPEAAEDGSQEEDEWQHTDTDAEFDDANDESFAQDHFAPNFRASTASSRGLPPPSAPHSRETAAQRRFLQRWSGGGDAFDSSAMLLDEDDLRASVTSQASRRSIFGRFPRRRTGRDSLE